MPFDFGGRYIYLRDDAERRILVAFLAADAQRCSSNTPAGTAWATARSARSIAASRRSTRYFVPLDENLEIWQLTVTNERLDTGGAVGILGSVEFCLWDAQDDATNFQRNFSIGQVEIEDGVIYHKTEYRERRNHFAWFACSEPSWPASTRSARRFSGRARGWDKPGGGGARRVCRTPWRMAGRRSARIMCAWSLQPGETRQIVFVLGYHENPVDEKFDPPDSQTVNKKTVKP